MRCKVVGQAIEQALQARRVSALPGNELIVPQEIGGELSQQEGSSLRRWLPAEDQQLFYLGSGVWYLRFGDGPDCFLREVVLGEGKVSLVILQGAELTQVTLPVPVLPLLRASAETYPLIRGC